MVSLMSTEESQNSFTKNHYMLMTRVQDVSAASHAIRIAATSSHLLKCTKLVVPRQNRNLMCHHAESLFDIRREAIK